LHDANWMLGYETSNPPTIGNSYGTTKFDFSNGSLSMIGPIDDGNDFHITNASYSTNSGELLLYTNGLHILGYNNLLITNGDSLKRLVTDNNLEIRYKSTDGSIQGCLFLPYPGRNDSIVMFYTGTSFNNIIGTFNQDLSMAVITNNQVNNQSIVVNKEIEVLNDSITYGDLTAVQHANGRDWWIVVNSRRGDYYYSILLDPLGFHVSDKIYHDIGIEYPGGGGQAKFSQDGTKYAIYGGGLIALGTWLNLFDFDRCTGLLSNQRTRHFEPKPNQIFFGGVAFSPNNRFLYQSIRDTIFQYDLEAPDPIATQQKVIVRAPDPIGSIPSYFQMQLAPDGKIYLSATSGMPYLHVIHEPDEAGIDCKPVTKGIRLKTVNSFSVPNHPNYRLGPLDGSPCDTLGLDNLPRAWWRYEQDTLNPNHLTFHDLSFYEPTTWDWTFGDGNVSGERHPEFTYQSPGVYEVCLTVSNFNGSDTHCKTIYGVTGTRNPALQAAIQVGPNPFAQRLTLTLSTLLASPRVQVLDLMGRTLVEQPVELGINELEVGHLPAGAYFWQVSTRTEGVVKSGKLVKM
jgi:PKD domain